MAKSASPRTQEVAFQLAQNWIKTNFKVYSQKSAMFEKVSWLGYVCHGGLTPWLKWGLSDLARPKTEQTGTVRPLVAILGHCRGLSSSSAHLLLQWLLLYS